MRLSQTKSRKSLVRTITIKSAQVQKNDFQKCFFENVQSKNIYRTDRFENITFNIEIFDVWSKMPRLNLYFVKKMFDIQKTFWQKCRTKRCRKLIKCCQKCLSKLSKFSDKIIVEILDKNIVEMFDNNIVEMFDNIVVKNIRHYWCQKYSTKVRQYCCQQY